ncbi:primosomal protein N' [Geothermobacter hydrogeniphilus]|uniref:Replication restart protein PriA n=1 Tax=Geothermobacter hydrogeniphilus TaxID=1969733 RepID=A0A2K2H979_9BACT|nr:primosomal protein N' [Geothermobacter hydrogeniphilus]PNU19821.1 primosomal protein N' [Geothermobacter hydrogeniphilus]
MSDSRLIAEVAVAAPLKKTLSYLVPPELAAAARIGVRLRVPLGRRRAVGFLLELSRGSGEGLKAIAEVLDDEPLFPPALIPLFRRAACYYLHPLGQVIATALPAGLSGRGSAPPILRETLYAPTGDESEPPGRRQRQILDCIRQAKEVSLTELRTRFDAPHAPLKRLLELGLISARQQERLRDPFLSWPLQPETPPEPAPAQLRVLEQLRPLLEQGGFRSALLHGVTGSGKTEVYLRAIETVLERGRQALVLVPEIALTPQLVGRFRNRFAGRAKISVLHSGLSDGERYDAWRNVARGEADIVIGARSAIFAPLPEPGLIIVDEEHETSYKQSEGFRYNARDLALLRGQQQGVPVLLGSATPALPSYRRALDGEALLLQLPGRAAGQPLPEVELIDMTATPFRTLLSDPLAGALEANLQRGEQSLVLLNRRGFAPYLLCADCGRDFRCPNCEISLTYHRGRLLLRCHYCDYQLSPPESCPRCGGSQLDPEGAGTERLELELKERFPEARLARMDRDTTTARGAHRRFMERMLAGEIDILVGTQMIAKGHDFPGVTLVGVVNADATLNFPDFRAGERTFALLSQVAGRAGRGTLPGRVLIQTYAPEHYALQHAASHDYAGFYRQELALRRELGYPPYGFLVNLVLSGNDPQRVERAARELAGRLLPLPAGAELLGPVPCLLAKLRGKARMQILLKAAQRPALRRALDRFEQLARPVPNGVSLAVDVDPVDMF